MYEKVPLPLYIFSCHFWDLTVQMRVIELLPVTWRIVKEQFGNVGLFKSN